MKPIQVGGRVVATRHITESGVPQGTLGTVTGVNERMDRGAVGLWVDWDGYYNFYASSDEYARVEPTDPDFTFIQDRDAKVASITLGCTPICQAVSNYLANRYGIGGKIKSILVDQEKATITFL